MDTIRKSILDYKQSFVHHVAKHNHPPMTGIVDTCSYCKTFGNLFEHGVVPLQDNTGVRTHLLCLNNT